jgi:hypothetical protein
MIVGDATRERAIIAEQQAGEEGVVRRMLQIVITAIAFIALPAGAQVYKCTEGGRTVYADKPCASDAKAIDVPTAPLSPEAAESAKLQSEANVGRLAVGQTTRQVQTAWGTPRTKNIDTRASGKEEQWVYDRKEGTTYVYIRDGKVVSVSQHQDATGVPPAPVQQLPPSATRAELEAQERADKAGERRFVLKGAPAAGLIGRIGVPEAKQFVPVGRTFGECWFYSPARLDPQTQTTICFSGGEVYEVTRTIQR